MQKICKQCGTTFEIMLRDEVFYRKIEVPSPTLCPTCRHQRRLAFRNELNLYKRNCDFCKKSIISVFPQDSKYTVYCNACWWSDSWDPMNYGKKYDPNRPFFEQLSELEKSIPHFALFQDGNSENCEYTNYGLNNKSCYLALCYKSEDVYYSHGAIECKSCVDIHKCMSCELCYECIDCTACYNLQFSKECTHCRDSAFLEDCQGCSDCFCSAGLRNRRFIFQNEQLTEKEYRTRIKRIKLTPRTIFEFKKQMRQIALQIPKKFMHGMSNENVTGDYIDHSKNLRNCFDCLYDTENLTYCDFCGGKCHDCIDCSYGGVGMELCYEMCGIATAQNSKFVCAGRNLQNCDYCQYVYASENLFGCIGLNHKKFCILNKQYELEEYQKFTTQIIENMRRDGEYGEFFPIWMSPFAYNETVAHEYYQLTKEEARDQSFTWKQENRQIINRSDALTCMKCGINFLPIKQEIVFYQKFTLPVPEMCPKCRHAARFIQRNPRKLWQRTCAKCGIEIQTAYAPNRPEIVYCEQCYLQEVY